MKIPNVGQVIAQFPSVTKSISVFIDEPIDVSLSKVERKKLQTRVVWEKTTNLPVRAGERLGHLEVWLGERKLNSVPLISEDDCRRKSFIKTFIFN